MTRSDFLKKIFTLYKRCFDEENAQTWLDAYKMVLPEEENYDELFRKVLITHDSISQAPTPKFLYDLLKPYNPRL